MCLGVVVHALILAMGGKESLADICESKASLVYKESSRPTRTSENMFQKGEREIYMQKFIWGMSPPLSNI